VTRLRELWAAGELGRWTAVEPRSGEPAHPEARALFAALPALGPGVSAAEVVELGLWSAAPRGLDSALQAPRYRPGRPLFVRAKVSHRASERKRPVGAYDAARPAAFTHLAELRARVGDELVVSVVGAPDPLRFPRADVFAWNEPTPFSPAGVLSGVTLDFDEPLLKAHVCSAYLELDEAAAGLDFGAAVEVVLAAQTALLRRLASRARLAYAGRGDGYSGSRAGALLSGGQGVCFVQRAAAAALLAPFTRTLGFDVAVAVGRTLRLGVPHGFLVLTLRPSLARFVVDPAWGEPLTDLRVAFFDAAWGHDRRLVALEGPPDGRVPAEAVDLPEAPAS
jgi:hypothetical protein